MKRRQNIMRYERSILMTMASLVFLVLMPSSAHADMNINKALSRGETVYVSIYSNVYAGPKGSPFLLSAMLSLRNTDPDHEITLVKADYFDTTGKMVEGYMKSPITLKPLASTFIYIREQDIRGGPGACFLVRWRSDKWVNQPIIEGVMLGLTSGQGVSFICPGQILVESTK
jgi:hypothetical protein